ncbi:hypothetical protein [Microlunatus speluncae]|uniref:hypothetical protein n=1 Tax=Microlunatus speluncae TaxID=2594267 RepID=UPI001266325E|nr:hypothetical protein [Microlunatus speluncae]
MSEQQVQPGGQQPQFRPPRLDDAEVGADWAPPQDDERRGLPGPAKAAIVILAIVVVIGGIWALGGFKVRTDERTVVQPGQLVKSGPYEFTFNDATVQKIKDYDDSIKWTLIVRGTGRTTGDESMSPMTGGTGMFLAKDPLTVETPESDTDMIGTSNGLDSASDFTPGLPPVPYQVEFTFSERYEPSKDVQLAVSEIEYSNPTILDTGEKTWNNGRDTFVYRLPVTVLPEDIDD